MPSDCNGIYFQQIFEKKLRIYLWVLDILTFLWILAPSGQHPGCWLLCQPSLMEIYYQFIDLNQDSKVIQEVIKKTLKTMKILTFFVNFLLNQIQNCSVQIKKMNYRIFGFQMKKNYFCQTTDDARHKNVPPPLHLARILKSYHKRNDRRKLLEK